MKTDSITIQDCLNMYQLMGKVSVLNDGKLIGFKQEEIPTQTANPSGDE